MSRAEEAFETVLTCPDDEDVILYTCGTTGRPKGALISHFIFYYQSFYMARDYWQVGADDNILKVAPEAHIFG